MKKWIFVLVLVLWIGFYFWNHPKKYQVTYTFQKYKITESFQNKNEFFFSIQKGKKKWIYTLEKKKKVRKKQIIEIETYQQNQLTCIIPIYQKEESKRVYCNLNQKQVSVDYLIKTNQEDFAILEKKIKKENGILPREYHTKKKKDNIKSYPKNIIENDIYILWNYKGIYTIEKDGIQYISFLEEDMYDNIMATVVGNYYALFENRSVNGIQMIYVYDFVKKKKFEYSIKEVLSKDSYINGVHDGYIYITDRKKKRQYRISIIKKKEEYVDQNETKYISYINGEKKEYSKSDFFMQDQIFINEWTSGKYKYVIEDGNIYKIYQQAKDISILVGIIGDVTEYGIYKDELLILKEDTLYHYHEEQGLRKILMSPELKYNYKNIYQLGKK